jgi:sugar-specific transcriptional regulator TrmB
MYEKELQNLGLSDKESKVYLASLELGADTAQNLAKKAGINRATTYVQIDSLKKKGLMSEFEKGKKAYYVAESPKRLSNLLGILEKELELKRSEIKGVLPALEGMFAGMGERPKVRFFEGHEGARAMTEDFLLTKDKNIVAFLNLDLLFQAFPKYDQDFTKPRVTSKVMSTVIYTREAGPVPEDTSTKQYRKAKYVSPKKLTLSSNITIYDDKVAILDLKNKVIGVIIENKDIADTLKSIFMGFWNLL